MDICQIKIKMDSRQDVVSRILNQLEPTDLLEQEELAVVAHKIYEVCDKEGFLVPFDQLCQYLKFTSSWKKAKEKFRAKFKKNVDYIEVKDKQGNGQTRVNYLLTAHCFQEFCMKTDTPICKYIRKLYIYVLEAVKKLKQGIDNGQIALVQLDRQMQDLEPAFKRGMGRIEGIKLGKRGLASLHDHTDAERTSMIVKAKRTKTGKKKWKYKSNLVGALYPMINGKINTALTGRTRGEFARQKGVKPVKKLNYISYWDAELLYTRNTIWCKITRVIADRQLTSHQEILECVDEILEPYHAFRPNFGHGLVQDNSMDKEEAMEAVWEYVQCKKDKEKLLKNN